jgi:type IX secretion system PorP/SprF family membrane protein
MKQSINRLSALLTVILMVAGVNKSFGQTDPHFTQNYTYPMYINPALAGSSDGTYRVSGIYRSEWGSFGNPYRTTGLSGDMALENNLAVGFSLLNQSAGGGGFKYLTTQATVAYTGVKLGKMQNHRMVFALQAGLIDRRVDEGNFKWGEQWNSSTGYSPNNPTTESFASRAATSLDMGTGVLYYDAAPGKKYNAFGGLSFYHINRPKDPVMSSESAELQNLPMRYTLHGGLSYSFDQQTSIVPHLLYMQQGNAREVMLGVYGQRSVNEETAIMAGAYYRVNDAFAPFVGVDFRNLMIGMSFDVNASKLGSMTKNVNSFELSLSYVQRKGTKSIFEFLRCPRF